MSKLLQMQNKCEAETGKWTNPKNITYSLCGTKAEYICIFCNKQFCVDCMYLMCNQCHKYLSCYMCSHSHKQKNSYLLKSDEYCSDCKSNKKN